MEVMSRRPPPGLNKEDDKIYDGISYRLNAGCIGGGIAGVLINMVCRDRLFGRFSTLHPISLIGQFLIVMATLEISL